MKEIAIGIDIGGTNSKIGLIERSGHIIAKSSIPTDTHEQIGDFLNDLSGEVNKLINNSSERLTVVGVGIGAPNGNYYKGTIEYAPNLNWKGEIRFTDLFKKHFDVPMVLTNDAKAAAIGEMIYGGAKEMRDFIIITLGTGLGSGIVVNGNLVYGEDGFAGEVGHTIVDHEGRVCGCGRKGCLETYVSATGIKRTIFELLATRTDESGFRDIKPHDLTAAMISKAALNGDPIAKEAFEITGKILGRKLADSVAYTRPEAIFLFGGLAKAGDLIFNPTIEHFEKSLLKIYQGKVKILPSQLEEDDAAIMGASALIWKEIK